MKQQGPIFQENQSQVKQDCITYSDLLKGDKYVSQFLNIIHMDDEDEDNINQFGEVEPQELIQEIQVNQEEKKLESVNEPQKQAKLLSFHNFQKHLVTTIRYVVQPTLLFDDNDDCGHKIWDCFMSSHKLNKTLVTILLGDISKEENKKLASYGFGSILSEFPLQQVINSQKNMVEGVIRQLKQVDLTKELVNRRMKNKEDFIVYFKQFMKQFQKGDLQKRMAKCTKILKRRRNMKQQ